jgi:23S rRNA pseudouridine2605 synthase
VLEHLGLQVSRLIRTAYGPFHLADLPAGAVDEVRAHDLIEFRKMLSSSAGAGQRDRPRLVAGVHLPHSPIASLLRHAGPERVPPSLPRGGTK